MCRYAYMLRYLRDASKIFLFIVILIAINWSFLYSQGFTEGLCGNVKFLGDGRKYNVSWMVICSNCGCQYCVDQSGITITAFVFSL